MDPVLQALEDQKKFITDSFKGIEGKVSTIEVGMGEMDKRLMDEIKAYETRIKEMEQRVHPTKVSLPGLEDPKEKGKFSFLRAFYGALTKDWTEAPFEKSIFDETARKSVMNATSGTAGAYIVPTEVIADLIEMFEADSVLIRAGATVMGGLTGSPVEFPRQTGGATAYWVGENQAIPESEMAFGMMSMSPKAVAALVKMSDRLIRLSNPSIEAMVRRDIALRVALKIDLAGLRGTGSSYQPLGVSQQPGINTVTIGADGGSINFDRLMDMEYELAFDNALQGNLAYIWHPCIKRNLLQLKVAQYTGDTGGEYIVQPITEQQLGAWVGYPYYQTTQIPITLTKGNGTALTEIYFGNWRELLIGQWGGMAIMASQETSDAFEKVQTWIRIIQEMDIAVRHVESFCLINDAKSSNV